MAFGWKSLASLSNRLSICAVAGVAVLALLPDQGRVTGGSSEQQPLTRPTEIARSRPSIERSVQRNDTGLERAADAKDSVQANAVPLPDTWADAQIIGALRECVRLLAPIAAEIEVSEPLKSAECGTPAPVALRSIGAVDKVEFRPAVPLNCRMVVALHKWVEQSLQPAARELFGSPIARISSSSYSCRTRYNIANEAISQHAFANAIDIVSFSTADGRTVDVLNHWGPTAREAAAERAATTAKAKSGGPKKDSEKKLVSPKAADRSGKQRDVQTAQMQLGAKAPATAAVAASALAQPLAPPPAEAQFLHRLHEGACSVFGTVLGPEANAAHRNHFHLDLAARRGKAFCQ